MTFSEALILLKEGKKVRNLNWNGKGMYLSVCFPSYLSSMDLPYIFMVSTEGRKCPWFASQLDLFSDAWEQVLDP